MEPDHIHSLSSSLQNSLSLPPTIMNIPDDILEANHALWEHTIIITLVNGDGLNPNHVMKCVRQAWRLQQRLDIIPYARNRFVCRFERLTDMERIIADQPWIIIGRLLLIQSFSADMEVHLVTFNTIPLWLGFRGLQLEHLNSAVVSLIASAARNVLNVLPQGVIPRTAEGYRARVEVLVSNPLIQAITVNTHHHAIVNNVSGLVILL
ncbi:hypothetical protein FRX31_032056 [Thalictrum thalictroides]|uniref:DUF4283 domain-containing protein n=1 Tax=Thalictrum thalictroides TaxID=46969 RepID=A0A7J6V0A0_THATH|nr:hypothetical protein FRX31_032056 [Thalictrum thalictroides]